MSDESKEQLSSADTSKEEVEAESRDTSMEHEDAETSKEKAGDKSEEESEDKEEEESDDEPQVGLLEKPLILEEGKKRERKKVERISFQSEEKAHEGLEIKEGKGRSLGDIPFIEFKLGRTKAEDCKPLHRLLYRRQGSIHEVKKNIRQFSGFPFSKDDAEYEKRMQILKGKSFTLPLIKKIMEVLDIPRSGSKDELITRLMEWLEKPADSGRKIPEPKRKRKSKGGSEKTTKGKKDKKKKEKKKKEKKTKETADDDDEDDDDMEEKDVEEEGDDKDDDDDKVDSDVSDISESEEDEPPKKKIKKSTPKPAKEKKTKEKATPKPKTPKATNKKKATPKKKTKVSSEEVSDVSSDSDDEPLVAKKTPKGPPTNDELKDIIKKMLDNANLEQVTMKTVLKDVFSKYPDFDLSDRKDFIKNTVKQIIS